LKLSFISSACGNPGGAQRTVWLAGASSGWLLCKGLGAAVPFVPSSSTSVSQPSHPKLVRVPRYTNTINTRKSQILPVIPFKRYPSRRLTRLLPKIPGLDKKQNFAGGFNPPSV